MMRRSTLTLVLLLTGTWFLNLAAAQELAAAPGGPLTCHKQVCPQPTSSCQVLESQGCLHGGGPPRCPAIINAPDGTSCSDGSACTTSDSCRAGVCGGSPVVCSSSTDTCTPSSGCATPCGPAGCVVAAAGGVLNPTLTVPAGALSAAIGISMFDQGGDPSDPSVFHVYSFAPAGTTFAIAATVDLPAPTLAANQTALIEVSDDGVTWTPVDATLNNGRVTGPIAHFSKCRTRATVVQGSTDLLAVDIVGYQEAIISLIPPPGEAGSCRPGGAADDIFGLCLKIMNSSINTFKSNCPVPTPNPPPAGCQQLHIIPWQCSLANRTLPPFDPANPDAYEGQHCDRDNPNNFLIPCPEAIYNVDQFLPGGQLAPGQELWVDMNFFVNPPVPANGVQPYSCIGGSGFFIGFDVIFREPSGDCSTAANCDWQGGIRSAKLGPFIEVPNGRQVFLPAGVAGCNPTPPATTCPATCGAASCFPEWEWLVNHKANYPTLRCERPGTPSALIACSQALPTDIVNKNWFIDSAF